MIAILAIISAVLYRVAGMGGFPNAKLIRRLGCPLVFLWAIWLKGFSLAYLGVYMGILALSYAAMSTYHDYLNNGDENWVCWLMTGFVYGLAAFPLVWIGVAWHLILIRAVVLSLATMLWSEWINWDILEGGGRGALYILTVPILYV